jgi:hypothetical protein
MVDNPFRLLVKQGTAGMDIDLVVVDQSSVPSFGFLASGMEEKS